MGDADLILRDHVADPEAQEQRVAEVDGYGDGCVGSCGDHFLYERLGRERPHRSRKVYGDGVDVDSGYRSAEPVKRF